MLNFFRIGVPPGNLVLVDAPGYGARGRREWGALFDAYVEKRDEYVNGLMIMHSMLKLSPLSRIDFDACTFYSTQSMVLAMLMKRCSSLLTKSVKVLSHCKLSSPKPIPSPLEVRRRSLARCELR